MVAPIPPTEHQSTMRTEIDVIRRAGPYFHMVVEALAPHVLAYYGYSGVLEWKSEVPMTGSRPDIILSYNGRNALVLDFKAPNCIREAELRRLGASSVGSALSKLPTPDESSLLELARQDERALVLQGLKYAEKTRAPFIVFYDYDYFFAMEPTPELINRKPNILLDVVLFREAAKSTRSQLVNLSDNHVSVLLRYVLRAVARVAS